MCNPYARSRKWLLPWLVLLLPLNSCLGGTVAVVACRDDRDCPENQICNSQHDCAAATTITIGFRDLTVDRAPVAVYTESGYTVSAIAADWMEVSYGSGPFMEFVAPAGTTVTGTIQITAGNAFGFKSVDLYSSITPIPYAIMGFRNSTAMFTLAETLPNTFGCFATVENHEAAVVIDTLVISLSNPAPSGGSNPIGVDNIVVTQ
jgi:hypothetical protein